MSDLPYTNRELDHHFKDVKETLGRIEAQTTRTNGRVGKLEDWRSYTAGAVAVIVLIGLPVLAFIATQVIKLSQVIR